jgi:sec-independent protein translocase protein TatA
MFGLEPWHIVLLLAVVLVIFGPKRLPEIGKNLGESIREFRKATTEFGDAVKVGAATPTNEAPATTPPAAVAPVVAGQVVAGQVVATAAAQETLPAASAPDSTGTSTPPAGTGG